MRLSPPYPLTPSKDGVHHQVSRLGRWIPIFIGMIGVLSMPINANADFVHFLKPKVTQEPPLKKGMTEKETHEILVKHGWEYVPPLVKADTTVLWHQAPCKAAAFDGTQTYERWHMGKPPRKMRVTVRFYECENEDVKALGVLSNFEFTENINAKNQ